VEPLNLARARSSAAAAMKILTGLGAAVTAGPSAAIQDMRVSESYCVTAQSTERKVLIFNLKAC
jgi:pyocin large subunit-like protein